ncbi:MAG: quinolinate synthase NadA [Candidatus Margulisbacteria bacterium]|nr:quinolinate synthase NadA [Candidatus Margulisiibacteriota bacterium]
MPEIEMIQEIQALKKEKNAIIVAHNYQYGEIQDIADFVGDSLELSKKASELKNDIIVFCGVWFMAETAKILAPDKKVLLPVKNAGCPMADMITAEQLAKLKKQHPKAKVVTYVNSNADVKALTDVCCTSANAVKIVQNIDAEEIIFVPDKNLGAYCQRFTDKKVILWEGHCYVHSRISPAEVKTAKQNLSDAPLIVHPECSPQVIDLADAVLSTAGMLEYVKKSKAKRFLIATEEGIIHRMKKENPEKQFYSAGTPKFCVNMKKTKLSNVLQALREETYQIEVPKDIAKKAKASLDRMLEYL